MNAFGWARLARRHAGRPFGRGHAGRPFGRGRAGRLVAALALVGGCTCERPPDGGATTGSAATTAVPAAPSAPAFAFPRTFTILERPTALPEQSAPLDAAAAARLLPPEEHARIELLEVGEGTRRVYRYGASVGQRLDLFLDSKVALTVESPEGASEMPVPAMRVALLVEVTAVSPQIRLAVTVAGVELSGAEAIAAEMQPIVARLKGAQSTMEMSPQGAVYPPPSPAADPATAQLWATIAEGLASVVIPLPSAAIGVGARYRVVDRVRRAGVVMLRASEVTASPGPDGFVALDAKVREIALAEGAHDPALGDEVRIEVIDAVSAGMRRVALSEGSPLPRVGAGEIASDLSLRAIPTKARAEPRTSTVHLTQVLALLRADAVDAGGAGAHGRGDEP